MEQTDHPPSEPDDTEGDLEPDAEQAKRVTGGSGKSSSGTSSPRKDPTKQR